MPALFPADRLFLIAGPCVLESDDLNFRVAEHLARLAERIPGGIIYKASFDKANRANRSAVRGPGIEEGLAARGGGGGGGGSFSWQPLLRPNLEVGSGKASGCAVAPEKVHHKLCLREDPISARMAAAISRLVLPDGTCLPPPSWLGCRSRVSLLSWELVYRTCSASRL
jgi:hypothetical protein